jgi:hypothetical protein
VTTRCFEPHLLLRTKVLGEMSSELLLEEFFSAHSEGRREVGRGQGFSQLHLCSLSFVCLSLLCRGCGSTRRGFASFGSSNCNLLASQFLSPTDLTDGFLAAL